MKAEPMINQFPSVFSPELLPELCQFPSAFAFPTNCKENFNSKGKSSGKKRQALAGRSDSKVSRKREMTWVVLYIFKHQSRSQ